MLLVIESEQNEKSFDFLLNNSYFILKTYFCKKCIKVKFSIFKLMDF